MLQGQTASYAFFCGFKLDHFDPLLWYSNICKWKTSVCPKVTGFKKTLEVRPLEKALLKDKTMAQKAEKANQLIKARLKIKASWSR